MLEENPAGCRWVEKYTPFPVQPSHRIAAGAASPALSRALFNSTLRPEQEMKHEDMWDLVLPPQKSHCEPGQATSAGIHTVLRSLPRCQSLVCISGPCSGLVSLAVSAVLTSVGDRPTYFVTEIGKLS